MNSRSYLFLGVCVLLAGIVRFAFFSPTQEKIEAVSDKSQTLKFQKALKSLTASRQQKLEKASELIYKFENTFDFDIP